MFEHIVKRNHFFRFGPKKLELFSKEKRINLLDEA